MKKLLFLLPLLALFVACQQDEPTGEAGRISFTNEFVADLTRADNTITTANLANFDVWGHNDNDVVFGGTRVEKQGDVWVSAEEKMWEHSLTYHFHAFSPAGLITNIGEYPNSERARGLSNFAYTNDGDKDLIYAYATRTQGSPRRMDTEPVQLPFEHLLSRVQFTFRNNLSEGNITITDVQITEAAKSAELNCADASIANWTWNATSTGAYDFGATGTIAKGASASAADVQFLFPAATRNYAISFNFVYESDAAEVRTATIADVNLVIGKAYNINVTIEDKDIVTEQYKIEFFVTEVKDWGENIELDATINEKEEETPDYNGHEYVDLGLSVKWATCNIGANSPEEAGDYFAWGEVEPKEYYDWSTYKHCEGSEYALTKYCDDSSYGKDGFVDNKIVLDPEDDAAHVNWGGSWRMPTNEEVVELIEKCELVWITLNGINGYKVIGPNHNSIFLPTGGNINGDIVHFEEEVCSYWTNSFAVNTPYFADDVSFYSDCVLRNGNFKNEGQLVRPVCP